MKDHFDIPLDRRIWALTRMDELREELSEEQREALLSKLGTITWSEWNTWFIANLKTVASYSDETAKDRKKNRGRLGKEALLVHHGAMFLVGLLYLAKSESFPHEFIHRNDQFNYDSSAMAASIRARDNIEAHCENSLHWQFDDPHPELLLPFKAESGP